MSGKQTREDRLAEKLRENLRKRKAQARAAASREGTDTASPLPNDGAGG